MTNSRWLIFESLVLPIVIFYALDLDHYFTVEYFKSKQAIIDAYYLIHPFSTVILFAFVYLILACFSLPGLLYLTVYAGTVFGFYGGIAIISITSTFAALIPFCATRFYLRDFIQSRFADNLTYINDGIERDGALYLFSLRLMPVSPFFVINLVMGLTSIRVFTYIIVSMLGMLPGTIVCVNAGVELVHVERLNDIFTIRMIFSFILLGFAPLAIKKSIELLRSHRKFWQYSRKSSS